MLFMAMADYFSEWRWQERRQSPNSTMDGVSLSQEQRGLWGKPS